MLPTLDAIDKYIQRHANRASIQRAKECRVAQDSLDDDSATYTCPGSTGALYYITLRYAKRLSAHCTCPYDYGGICKHSVAALRASAPRFPRGTDLHPHARANHRPCNHHRGLQPPRH